jgi:hypothetical protein
VLTGRLQKLAIRSNPGDHFQSYFMDCFNCASPAAAGRDLSVIEG